MKKLIETRQALFPEEREMPLAKYYHNYPFYDLPEDVKAKIYGLPMDFREAILPEKFIDWLLPVGEYTNHENGYCMLPDGTGYICTYMQIPETVEPRKIFWYLKWLNTHSRSMVLGHGNLRYKIWNPADHFDHYFVNWVDADDGVFTTESLDIGQGERQYNTIRHSFNLRDYGLTDEKIAALNSDNYKVKETSDWESFDFPGAHLTLGQIRPRKEGGWERRSVEWIGWRPSQGKLIREERTPCNEAYLRKVANHTLTEWYHLMTFVNDLYNEYVNQPMGYQPVAGYNWGAKRYDRVHESLTFGTKLSVIGSFIMGALIFAVAGPVVRLFNTQADAAVLSLGILCIRLQCVALPIHAWTSVVNMFYAGIGKAKYALLISTARQGYCFIPALFLLVWIVGADGIAATQALADVFCLFVVIPLGIKAVKFAKYGPEADKKNAKVATA